MSCLKVISNTVTECIRIIMYVSKYICKYTQADIVANIIEIYIIMYNREISPGVVNITTPAFPLPIELVATTENV